MANPRDIRTAALMLLFQMDAELVGGASDDSGMLAAVEAAFEEEGGSLTDAERARASEMARGAWRARRESDGFLREVAPEWPPHRMPAVDRAILRLAMYEMSAGSHNPKIAVNEAIELAKRFSTDKSPAFVNALLDKALKRMRVTNAGAETGGEG